MTPALRNAAAMRRGQFAYDHAEPEHDHAREEAEERIGELLDEGDQDTAEAFAEYAYGVMSHAEIIDAMAALFRVTDSKWRHLRDKLCEDVVSGPLDCLRICMGIHRAGFIAERATQQLQGDDE
ncbi:MAG: hypothetical protein NDI93_00705 [Pseudomonas sp.]|nr:hypothetical protein [Pseudomonas sp.]